MAENTEISWTDHTFNPWIGCTKVSPGCDNCYAEQRMDKRFHRVEWGPGKERIRTNTWGDPRAWNGWHDKFFAEHGRRQRVFCASLADVFDNEVPPVWRAELFALIAATQNLDWLLLTKRIGNVAKMIEAPGMQKCGLPRNVWIGATIVNQEEADRDLPKLLAVPARVRFLSMEPLLGPVEFSNVTKRSDAVFQLGKTALDGIHWVIVGGESGAKARPMHHDWARSLRDQCASVGVPFHFKQWGEWLPWTQFSDADVDDPPEQTKFKTLEYDDGEWRDVGYPMWCDSKDGVIDDMQCVGRVGKKAAGRRLDGVTHDGFPEVP